MQQNQTYPQCARRFRAYELIVNSRHRAPICAMALHSIAALAIYARRLLKQ